MYLTDLYPAIAVVLLLINGVLLIKAWKEDHI